ncbi:MAG: hypothetical protein A4S09_16015 [Proteobacteria bacterium SG_bin7]|nr:MAG: hypothetical protein A4S09_16015 [Proteobacteria bacterium SG_bin7]
MAVLRLHEIIYSVARDHGHTNSKDTRILVGHLITKNNKITIGQIEKAMKAVGFDLSLDQPPKIFRDLATELSNESEKILNTELSKNSSFASVLARANVLLNEISVNNKYDLYRCETTVKSVNSINHCRYVLTKFLESVIQNVKISLNGNMREERHFLVRELESISKQIVASATAILAQQLVKVISPKILSTPEYSRKTLESVDLAFRKGIEEFYRHYTVMNDKMTSVFELEKFLNYDVVVIDE